AAGVGRAGRIRNVALPIAASPSDTGRGKWTPQTNSGRTKRPDCGTAARAEDQLPCFLLSSSSRSLNLIERSLGPLSSAQAICVILRSTLVLVSGYGCVAN